MATGGKDLVECDDVLDECTVCLEPFTDPRFLPCHHTFCAKCIHDLVDRHEGAEFPCPWCRKVAALPAGGVNKLPQNYYIKRQATRDTTKCRTHEDQDIKFYCAPCEKVICTDCKLTKHEGHPTQDLKKAVERVKGDLVHHQDRIQRAVGGVKDKIETIKAQKQKVQSKNSKVCNAIQDRRSTLIKLVNKMSEQARISFQSLNDDINEDIDTNLRKQEQIQQQLLDIQQKLQHAVNEGTGSDVIAVAREIKSGRGSDEAVKRLTSEPVKVYECPVLKPDITERVMSETVSQLLGSVVLSNLAEAEMTVEKKFNCGKSPRHQSVFTLSC